MHPGTAGSLWCALALGRSVGDRHLNENRLETVPAALSRMPCLTLVDLDNNPLVAIPGDMYMRGLTRMPGYASALSSPPSVPPPRPFTFASFLSHLPHPLPS
eukprot:253766-Rhodomonas_salina.4